MSVSTGGLEFWWRVLARYEEKHMAPINKVAMRGVLRALLDGTGVDFDVEIGLEDDDQLHIRLGTYLVAATQTHRNAVVDAEDQARALLDDFIDGIENLARKLRSVM